MFHDKNDKNMRKCATTCLLFWST